MGPAASVQAGTVRHAIARALRAARRVLLVAHVDPDGDTLGGTLALALALRDLGVEAVVGSPGGVPPVFAFLPGAGEVVTALPDEARFDVAVAMECGTLERCGAFAAHVSRTPLVVVIDHHESAVPFGHLNDIDPQAAAVGEMVAALLETLEVPLTPPVATALLTAVATDTGVFRFPTVRPATLRLAARLLEAGAPLDRIVREVYENRTPAAARLLGLALARMVVTLDGAVAYTVVTDALRREGGAEGEETVGVIGLLRAVRGVRLAALFEETDAGVRVSLRSRDGVRSHAIAARFGGGGHPGAAGCLLPGPLPEAVARVLEAAAEEVRLAALGAGASRPVEEDLP
ncbi:MAG: DHHA1 domain-containing protein [Armatimonadota bacterium]|nr:DHHA1 domain-containing protein [Armatimonadota bacterium]MDR7449719.1 DHHA1 domain-containing protein [Armatimonadota bacterium]MDR7458725.1 DHHA1 domain-containing protein [Armatimonadota bacterium]MDR7479334.1 DHHA1 domain-containing protein [Armatimonadota bacterium]MDR7489748.1 DHHA1 domain-containing protein [Armatimonadota bacterium]